MLRKLLSILLVCIMCFGSAVPVMADDGSDGTLKTDMPEGEDILVTLADDWSYRWNANGMGLVDSVIHLDTYKGSNCSFRLFRVKEGGSYTDYYGIRYEGTEIFADINGKSKDDGAVLHLYTSEESELENNHHRQFAFYYVKTDEHGNNYYYIKNRNSGLWMGYEDKNENGKPDAEEKICQTTAGKRKLWIITNGVVPKQGGETEDLIEYREGSTSEKEGGVFVSLFKKDTIESVTSNGDLAAKYTNMHFYRMGTNSKMLLKWDSRHSAYEILYYTDGENYREAVWDLESEGAQENADVHLWSRESKSQNKNTSQLWRFFRQSDRSYLIQNARTGKYIAYQYDKDDEGKDLVSSGTLKQFDGKEGIFGDDVRKLAYFTLDRFAGEDNPVNFNYSADWMADIPNDALVSSINIPGTHDTGTASVNFDASGQASLSSCQKYYYGEQLNVGARSFDIRCDADNDDASLDKINIVHGNSLVVCHERGTNFTPLTLKSLLDDSIRFLNNHSSETIILTIKRDAGSEVGLAKALGEFIKDNKKYFWTGDSIPTMGEARGKIILFRRYKVDYDYVGAGVELKWFGPDLTNWDNYSYSDYEYAIPIYDNSKQSVYVQDAYSEGSDSKRDFIKGTLKQTTGEDKSHEIPGRAWVYNYTSCAGGFPLGLTRDINPWLYSGDGSKYFDNRRLGMVMLNFIDVQMSKLVYETNFNQNGFFELKSSAPTKVAWTYGEPIGNAEISGQTGAGTWTFDDPKYVPSYQDYKDGKTFKMTFTPEDNKTYRTVSAEVKITDFIKRPISVDVADKEMTYGGEIPELTFKADTSQLVKGDTVSDLKISLDIDKLYSTTGRLRAGQYKIKGSSDSELYDVTFTSTGKYNGSLIVYRKGLEIAWSDTSNLVYNGSPVNVTAKITGVLEGDDCSVYVTGGKETGPSWDGDKDTAPTIYTATAHVTGADYLNYILPEDNDDKEYQTSKKYYIRRADPSDFNFPTEAIMTYGQKLSDAELELASGDGRFVFVEDEQSSEDIGDTVPEEAGTYEYMLKYVPSDSGEKPAYKEVTVTVKPKKITVKAVPGEKVYGTKTVLDFQTDEEDESNALVADDTKEDLKLTLMAVDTEDSSIDGDRIKSPVGLYEIQKKECGNDNYEVTVVPAEFRILRKAVSLVWSEQTSFEYTGDPVNVTAVAKGLLPGDVCEVNVENGDRIQPGTYVAKAVSLTNDNYKLPDDESLLNREYVINGSASDGDDNDGGANDDGAGPYDTDSMETSDPMSDTLTLCMIMLCLSLAGIIASFVYRRKRKW